MFRSKLSFTWRFTLATFLALPLTLSVAYKSFAGGHSAKYVNAADYVRNASYYGMFALPGLQSIGQGFGITIFSNATLPFAIDTSASKNVEPQLPTSPKAYGYNVLMLSNESVAILDIPQPEYVSRVQRLLAVGESWRVTARVLATVSRYNNSRSENPEAFRKWVLSFCEAAEESSGAYSKGAMRNASIALLDHTSPGDQPLQAIAITSGQDGIDYLPTCDEFAEFAKLYNITRQQCTGTWSITRGGTKLLSWSCSGTIAPWHKQQIIVDNAGLFMPVFYMDSLAAFMDQFSIPRNGSVWVSPYMATSMAAMLWSRITVLDSAANLEETHAAPIWTSNSLLNLSYEDAGLIYAVPDTTRYIRPTLQKPGLLYFVLALQPILTALIRAFTMMFYSTPISKGFGLISILSGINRSSLDGLASAALSGELDKSVKLTMQPIHDNGRGVIEYHVSDTAHAPVGNSSLARNVVYG